MVRASMMPYSMYIGGYRIRRNRRMIPGKATKMITYTASVAAWRAIDDVTGWRYDPALNPDSFSDHAPGYFTAIEDIRHALYRAGNAGLMDTASVIVVFYDDDAAQFIAEMAAVTMECYGRMISELDSQFLNPLFNPYARIVGDCAALYVQSHADARAYSLREYGF